VASFGDHNLKKQGNELAIRNEANLAAAAWERLQTAAQETMNGDVPALQLCADTNGITALIRDEFGTSVTVQRGRISVNVAATTEAE
jgi:hypothetical protein